MKLPTWPVLLLVLTHTPRLGAAEPDLAKELANPVSSLISVPFQGNWDEGVGPRGGQRFTLNVQPVVPVSLNDGWNMISRTILPIIDLEGAQLGGTGDAFGLGDTTQSFFFSPTNSEPIWGIGPIFLLPTATESALGADQWGLGPTGVLLKQQGPWTYGVLANHVWDVAGGDSRGSVNSTFLQPFVAYITPTKTTFSLNSESTYNWQSHEWTVPINLVVSQLLKVGSQPTQVFVGGRYYIERPSNGPEWGLRFGFTLLFPQ